jgi:hypothetical protein
VKLREVNELGTMGKEKCGENRQFHAKERPGVTGLTCEAPRRKFLHLKHVAFILPTAHSTWSRTSQFRTESTVNGKRGQL